MQATASSRCAAVQVDFYGNHRNMTVTAPSLGILIRHRFTGHSDLTKDMMGLDTFFHPSFQDEYDCLVKQPGAPGCAPRRPDVLVINSGLHDIRTTVPKYAMTMRTLAKQLRQLRDSGTQVIWRGNNALPTTHGLDIISRHYLEAEGVPFVDTRAVMDYFTEDLASGCCSDLRNTGGAHIGAIANYHNASSRLTVSSMVTQDILSQVCMARQNISAIRRLLHWSWRRT